MVTRQRGRLLEPDSGRERNASLAARSATSVGLQHGRFSGSVGKDSGLAAHPAWGNGQVCYKNRTISPRGNRLRVEQARQRVIFRASATATWRRDGAIVRQSAAVLQSISMDLLLASFITAPSCG